MKQNSILENIPDDWEIMRLSEAILINPKRDLKKGATAKKVSMDNLEPFNKKIKNFEVEIYSGGSKFINEDILMARITPCLENGKTAFVDILAEGEIAFGSTEFIVFSGLNTKTVSDYIYYLAISPRFRLESIKSMTGTSGRQRVQIDSIEKIQIPIPPLPEQKTIAKVLSDLDEKIELNNEMNKTLEEIGQALFKRWFIDFEFPDENGNPYRSFSGEMVFLEELGKEIPKGWEVKRLDDLADFLKGKRSPAEFYVDKTHPEAKPYIRIADFGNSYVNVYTKADWCLECIETDTLLATDGSIGLSDFGWKGVLTHHILCIRPKKELIDPYLLYTIIKLNEKYLASCNTASVSPTLRQEYVKSILLPYPTKNTMEKYGSLSEGIRLLIKNNKNENKSLSELRDSLLPKLMSGEIRVPLEASQ